MTSHQIMSLNTDEPITHFSWKPTHPTPLFTPTPLKPVGYADWGNWKVDRLVGFIPDEERERFDKLSGFLEKDDDTGIMLALKEDLLSYDGFDGEIAFIPTAFKDNFWSFLVDFMTASLEYQPSLMRGDEEISIPEDVITVGGSSTWFVGHSTPNGLWIIYVGSEEDGGNTPLATAIEAFSDLNPVNTDFINQPDLDFFDVNRAWRYGDCHLLCNLKLSRSQEPIFKLFLESAVQEGGLFGSL